VLTLKRSILTEKISRRGYHLSREYSLDPLEILFASEVMQTNMTALPGSETLAKACENFHNEVRPQGQYLFPVVDEGNILVGVVTRKQFLKQCEHRPGDRAAIRLSEIAIAPRAMAFADEPLRVIVHRMAELGVTRLPVVDAKTGKRLVGMISLNDLLRARAQNLEEERTRERVLRIRFPFGRDQKSENDGLRNGSERKSLGKSRDRAR
jgi:chloride channel protein, CIC family